MRILCRIIKGMPVSAKMNKIKRKLFSPLKKFSVFLFPIFCVFLYLLLIDILRINAGMIYCVHDKIIPLEQTGLLDKKDCIVIPGASIRNGTKPSPMLEDRLLTGLHIYRLSGISKFLMSGDHAIDYYNEVEVMKNYVTEYGVPSKDVFMDHSGFSTYETIFRAQHVFAAKTIIFVSQKYHLYRGLYIAREQGLQAQGVAAPEKPYQGQLKRSIREILARYKDYYLCLFHYKPQNDMQIIPISGNGNITNSK